MYCKHFIMMSTIYLYFTFSISTFCTYVPLLPKLEFLPADHCDIHNSKYFMVHVFEDCSSDICILICFVLLVLCCCFFFDKFHVRLFVQQNLWTYETLWYVCMYYKTLFSATLPTRQKRNTKPSLAKVLTEGPLSVSHSCCDRIAELWNRHLYYN
jgi:hypothetical protein